MTTQTLNHPENSDSQNVKVVDEFLQTEIEVSANEYDYVLGFFRKVMKDDTMAENATMSTYQVAKLADIPALEIVQSLQGQTGLELSTSLAYLINSIRSPATLLGIIDPPKPNYYAARNTLI